MKVNLELLVVSILCVIVAAQNQRTTILKTANAAMDHVTILECLMAHNEHRRKHIATLPMVWDDTVQQSAQQWADTLASSNRFYHSPGYAYGENLYWHSYKNLQMACKEATDAWYNEIELYNYNNPGFSAATGHFTQVVWRASTKLGVGIARGRNGVYVVAQYSPPGNYMGRFTQNVMKTKN